MTTDELAERLCAISCSEDGMFQFDDLCAELIADGAGLEAVETILDFLEDHDDTSLCCGIGATAKTPLMAFVERFSDHGFLELLMESVERKPRLLTVELLERAITRERDRFVRTQLIESLEAVSTSFFAENHVRDWARTQLSLLRRMRRDIFDEEAFWRRVED